MRTITNRHRHRTSDTLADRIHAHAATHMTDQAWILRVLEDHLTTQQP